MEISNDKSAQDNLEEDLIQSLKKERQYALDDLDELKRINDDLNDEFNDPNRDEKVVGLFEDMQLIYKQIDRTREEFFDIVNKELSHISEEV